MGSNKAFLLLGLSLAIVLLISSEVAARELAEAQTTTTNKNTEAATVDGRSGYNGYGGGGYHNGGGGYHNGGGGYHNGGGGYHNGGGGYHNGGGGYHNGGGGYHNGGGGYHNGGGHGGGGCQYGYCHSRCCNFAGEVVDAETTGVKPQN